MELPEGLDPRNHPPELLSHFRSSTVVVYACDPEALKRLLPPHLDLDTAHGRGFLSVAFVDQRSLRPKWLPERFGLDVFLVEYLVFVRFKTDDGRVLLGLYLVGSETDSWPAAIGCRFLTHYGFRHIDLQTFSGPGSNRFQSNAAGIRRLLSLIGTTPAHFGAVGPSISITSPPPNQCSFCDGFSKTGGRTR
ncbi:MAG: DUF2071 domain-containing protein [Acidimicrobiales bacterium]